MRTTQIMITLATVFLTQPLMAQGQGNGPPTVDANVLNFPDVQSVEGTVSVSNFPESLISPFARTCVSVSDSCSIDLTGLAGMGEVHITHASGVALNVGEFASPRFSFGSALVLLNPTVNSTGTGLARDIVFSQSVDLIPLSSIINFSEPNSGEVFFYIAGYVVGSTAADAAAAKQMEASITEPQEVPR